MALIYADRVKETTTTTGTGTYSLAGAVTGYQTFVAGIGNANTCYYCVTDDTDWEVGLGTVTDAAPDTLSRDTIIASTNAGAAVNWGAGTKAAFCTLPGDKVAKVNAQGNLYGNGIPNKSTGAGTYTLLGIDNGYLMLFQNGTATVVTIPNEATEVLPVGYGVIIVRDGAGTVSWAVQGTDTVKVLSGATQLTAQNSSAYVVKLSGGVSSVWGIYGDVSA